MKKSKFRNNQTLSILRQAENGLPASGLYREHDINNATLYNWYSKYGGMDASLMAKKRYNKEEDHRLSYRSSHSSSLMGSFFTAGETMKKQRRKHTVEFKVRVALEVISGITAVSEIAAEFEIHPPNCG